MRSDKDLPFDASDPTGLPLEIEKTAAFSHSGGERNHVFINLEGKQFLDISAVSGADDLADGRACGFLDYDRDGWRDVLVVNANAPFTRLWRNGFGGESPGRERGKFVALRFVGSQRGSQSASQKTNRDGYGAKAYLALEGGPTLLREYRCGEGMASQNSSTVLVGMGDRATASQLRVVWPSGVTHEMDSLPAGALATAYEDPSQSPTGGAFVVQPYEPAPLRATAAAGARRSVLAQADRLRGEGPAALTLLTTTASWCPKCKGELPQLAELRQAFTPEQLALRGIPADPEDTREKLEAYVAEYHPSYEMALDLSPTEVRIVTAAVEPATGSDQAFPATLVLDQQGQVLLAQAGVPTVSQLRKLLNQNAR